MIKYWQKLPEQIKRLSVLFILLAVVLIYVSSALVPEEFGKYGHYRGSAIEEAAAKQLNYAGQDVCNDCHDDIMQTKYGGYHIDVSCEVCHGPSYKHSEDPSEVIPIAPRTREYCVLCHEYLSSRPTGFPQIISASHNPVQPCIKCHDPHDPKPDEIPRECDACHAEISRSKSLSKHVNIPCTRCHNADENHKVNPRAYKASIPGSRDFCGECHSEDSQNDDVTLRINLEEHEVRYVCWQCHYPHLPESH